MTTTTTQNERFDMDITELCERSLELTQFYEHVSQMAPVDILEWPRYKGELCELVGWCSSSTDETFHHPYTWNIAYQHMINLMEGGS